MPHALARIVSFLCFASTLLAATAAGAAEQPTSVTSQPLTSSPEGSLESDGKSGERGTSDVEAASSVSTLPAGTSASAAEQPTTATSEPLTPSPEGSFESDDKPGKQGASDGPDGPGGPGGPGGFGGPGDESGYSISWYPSASVSGQGTELGIVRNRLSGDIPVWFRDADAVMAGISVEQSHFSGEARLPDTLRVFPSDLWKIQVGMKHMHQFSGGRSSMLMFDIESASDKPFKSSREIKYTMGGFYLKPAKNGRDSWMFGAIYSPMGWPNFPIPLVAYKWNPSERFHMSIGLPLSLNWKPTDKLSIDMGLGPSGVDALATYKLSDRLRAYGGYQQPKDQYFLSGRANRDDAFFAVEQRWIVGLRRDLRKGLTLDLHAGYAFDRHYGEGEDEQDLHDRVNLENSAFFGAKLIW